MKALVVYDSKFGNTERLARAIVEVLGAGEAVAVVAASAASAQNLAGIELLVVGGPTQAHGLSPALKVFLESLPADALRDLPAATFDTRGQAPRFITGSAAAGSAKRLAKKGARVLMAPESFLVTGMEGPLAEGELARAQTWATSVRAVADRSAPQAVAAS